MFSRTREAKGTGADRNRILAIWYVYFRLELRPLRDFKLAIRNRGTRSGTVLTRQCGIGPTGEACRIDDGPEVPCTGHNQACEDMKAEIKWVPSMENHDALPYVIIASSAQWSMGVKPREAQCDMRSLQCSYKYRMDVDGYGWSSRFRKLLSSKSLIIKPTVYVSSIVVQVKKDQC